jgi:hypothetical protein
MTLRHRPNSPTMSNGTAQAPFKAIPAPVSDLNAFRVRRHDRIGGIIAIALNRYIVRGVTAGAVK